jgi:mannose-6-phosphate isomerase-like protein (cupin superfamily)
MRAGGFQVKSIDVLPGQRLSLQSHEQRSEHWIVIDGTARVMRDAENIDLVRNESVYLPAGTVHRLENPSDTPLKVIEVAVGDYLGEDDIVRFDDDWDR